MYNTYNLTLTYSSKRLSYLRKLMRSRVRLMGGSVDKSCSFFRNFGHIFQQSSVSTLGFQLHSEVLFGLNRRRCGLNPIFTGAPKREQVCTKDGEETNWDSSDIGAYTPHFIYSFKTRWKPIKSTVGTYRHSWREKNPSSSLKWRYRIQDSPMFVSAFISVVLFCNTDTSHVGGHISQLQ